MVLLLLLRWCACCCLCRVTRRAALREQHGVSLLHFEQHLDEAVLIPGDCPHQVRNLASCCKVRGRSGWACAMGTAGSNGVGKAAVRLGMNCQRRGDCCTKSHTQMICNSFSRGRHHQTCIACLLAYFGATYAAAAVTLAAHVVARVVHFRPHLQISTCKHPCPTSLLAR
jgi:hypothetical protein